MTENTPAVLSEDHSTEQQEPAERSENCSDHGQFTAKRYSRGRNWRGDHDYRWTRCPRCKEEREQAEAASRAEAARRYRKEVITARIEAAGIPPRFKGKSFEEFQVDTEEQRLALELCRRYIAEFKANFNAGRSLVVCGTVGTGKTHLACAILHAVALMCGRVRYLTISDLIFRLRRTWAKGSSETEMDVLSELCNLDLLVLDEVGVQFGTEAEKVQLFNVINGRYNLVKPTVIISNLDLEGMVAYLGERAVDRLKENAVGMVVLTGKSRRAPQKQ